MPIFSFLFWLLLIWLAGPAALPLARRIWKNALPDAGLAAGRVLLLCLWTLLAFWLGCCGVPVRTSALLVFPILVLAFFFLWRDRAQITSTLRANRRGVLVSEGFFFAAFAFFLLLRGFWPSAADGEKPMDMALLSSLSRAAYLPPANPFAAGERLHEYYYFGHLQAALLTDAAFSSPRWTYNLMCATLPALVFSSLFSLCSALSGRLRYGVLAALLVLCCGTLEPLRLWFPAWFGAPLDARPYFATSRVIPHTINEYPFFTFCYGDLHAHFFAMPLAVLTMCLAWALWRNGASTRLVILCAAVLAALLMTNSWDLPLYTMLIVLSLHWKRRAQSLFRAFTIIALLLAFAFPFWSRLQTGAGQVHLVGRAALEIIPWLLVWGLTAGTWCLVFVTRFGRRGNDEEYFFLCRLALCGVLALLWSELFWSGFLGPPYERQDTVFKFGLQAWYLLGTAAACGILRFKCTTRRGALPLRFLYCLLVPITLFSSCLVVLGRGRGRGFQHFIGFDAWQHLAVPERQAAHWLTERARDGDGLFEAEKADGGDYTAYSRYAHATGIPAVIGPRAHSFQWLGSWEKVSERRDATHALYTSHDALLRDAILRKYPVRWIVIGELERREYGVLNCWYLEQALPVVARFGAADDSHRVLICHNPLR